jgi:hypothetical protein
VAPALQPLADARAIVVAVGHPHPPRPDARAAIQRLELVADRPQCVSAFVHHAVDDRLLRTRRHDRRDQPVALDHRASWGERAKEAVEGAHVASHRSQRVVDGHLSAAPYGLGAGAAYGE